MAQKDNLQPLHVEISNSEVSANLKVCVTIDLRLINQKYPRKYLKAEDIARELNSRTGEDYWSERKVNKKLAELGYQIKPYQAKHGNPLKKVDRLQILAIQYLNGVHKLLT
ncbi:MAG: hypothetical protein PT120_25885 [Aphanizomenon gracile PMC649.10]|nr:hypothetical protein [Aphanizomenon gracile PMC638.10]MDM3858219.1 hypothetical protein [Aphanizomenon gracile PMC649.10]